MLYRPGCEKRMFLCEASSSFDIVGGESLNHATTTTTTSVARKLAPERMGERIKKHRSFYDATRNEEGKREEKEEKTSSSLLLEHRANIYERMIDEEQQLQKNMMENITKARANLEEKKEENDGVEVRREEAEIERKVTAMRTFLERLTELETGYTEGMREFREGPNSASLEKLNRLGEAYHNATREYVEELENWKKNYTTTAEKEASSKEKDQRIARIVEYENMWKNKLGMNEFPEEPLASNAYFPEFLPNTDAETLCKKFISFAKEVSNQTKNIIQFPDMDFFSRHAWPTIGKLIEGSAVIAESKVRSLYKSHKEVDEPFKFEMVPAQVPVDQFKFSKISNCPNRENVYSCLFGKRSENEEENNKLCTKWTIPKSTPNRDDDEGDSDDSYFSRQAAKNPKVHAVLTGAIINYMAPQIYVDNKFSRVKCTRENDIESGRESGEVFFVSIHGRRGDSCNLYSPIKKYGTDQWNDPGNRNLGRACFASLEYKKALQMLLHKYYDQGGNGKFKSVTVLLASDSAEFIQDMIRETGNNELDDDDEINYCWVDPETPRVRDVYGTEKTYRKNVNWIENRADLDDNGNGEVVSDLSLAEIDHLAKGYALIGGLHGHFTRAVYFLISGRLGMPAPYVALDGSGFMKRDYYLQMRATAASAEDFGESWFKWMNVMKKK